MVLEERQRVIVQDLNGGHRQLGGVEPGPNVAAEAVEHSLDLDLADALERAREEGVNGHKFARGAHLDVPLAVLGVESLQRLDLLLTQLDPRFGLFGSVSRPSLPVSAAGGDGSGGRCGATPPAPRPN